MPSILNQSGNVFSNGGTIFGYSIEGRVNDLITIPTGISWGTSSGAPRRNGSAIGGNVVYFTNYDNRVYRYHKVTHGLIDSFPVSSILGITSTESYVFIHTDGGISVRTHGNPTTQVSYISGTYHSIAASTTNNVVYALDSSGRVYEYDATTFSLIKSTPTGISLGGSSSMQCSFEGDRLFIGTRQPNTVDGFFVVETSSMAVGATAKSNFPNGVTITPNQIICSQNQTNPISTGYVSPVVSGFVTVTTLSTSISSGVYDPEYGMVHLMEQTTSNSRYFIFKSV